MASYFRPMLYAAAVVAMMYHSETIAQPVPAKLSNLSGKIEYVESPPRIGTTFRAMVRMDDGIYYFLECHKTGDGTKLKDQFRQDTRFFFKKVSVAKNNTLEGCLENISPEEPTKTNIN